jgi:hypothetical protein
MKLLLKKMLERSKENASFQKDINKLEENEKKLCKQFIKISQSHPKKLMTKIYILFDALDIHKSNLVVLKFNMSILTKHIFLFCFFS